MPAVFSLGRLVITPGAHEQLDSLAVHDALVLHSHGKWGDLDAEDAHANDRALVEGGRLFSVYRDCAGTKFWIITEADRSVTTILLPSEY